MIKAVLFDIGNVFVHWSPRFLYEKLIPDSDKLDHFLKNIVTLEWHTEHDRGRPFKEGVRILTEQYPEYADLVTAFDDRWDETINGEVEGMAALAYQLADMGVPLYALTNFSQEKWPAFAHDYAFTKLFKGVVVSGEEGMVKPDPQIYQIVLVRYGLRPEEILFIDDRDENIFAAEKLGMHGHIFKSATLLEGALEEHGLL